MVQEEGVSEDQWDTCKGNDLGKTDQVGVEAQFVFPMNFLTPMLSYWG